MSEEVTQIPRDPDAITKTITQRLSTGRNYLPEIMRDDLVVLLNLVANMNALIAGMVEDPKNAKVATQAAMRLLNKALNSEQDAHKLTKSELTLCKAELGNLRKWIRVNRDDVDKKIDVLTGLDPSKAQ